MTGYLPRSTSSFTFIGFSSSICVDTYGTIWCSNSKESTIFHFTKNCDPIIVAGKGTHGYVDGNQDIAEFASPRGICSDMNGNIYVCDAMNHVIRKITRICEGKFVVCTVAGLGEPGCEDGGLQRATFYYPDQIAIDRTGNFLYVVQHADHVIRGIDLKRGTVWTVAGVRCTQGFKDGPASQALFRCPFGVAVAPGGAVYVSDWGNHAIRKIENGLVSTIIGDGTFCGISDGSLSTAKLCNPQSISVDEDGIIVITDAYVSESICREHVRRIDIQRNEVSTIAVRRACNEDCMQITVVGKMILTTRNMKGTCRIRRWWNKVRWNEVRILWIGNLKESPDECVLARLPPEIISGEIIQFLLYPSQDKSRIECYWNE